MLENRRPRAIILEDNEIILQSAKLILSKQGWNVTCETVSQNALQTLKKVKQGPITLFITNFRLPKMTGDDILEQVKKISPLTRRLIMVSPEEPEILIRAVNRALVHACITAPFQEEDLIYHSRTCFREFKERVKRERLKRVTRHQNQQMYKVAQKLKQKDESFQKSIKGKKRTIAELQTKLKGHENQLFPIAGISLASYIKNKGISPLPDIFLEEFTQLCRAIASVFDLAAGDPGITLDLTEVFCRDDGRNNASGPGSAKKTVKDGRNHPDNKQKDTRISFCKNFLELMLAQALGPTDTDVKDDLLDEELPDNTSDDPMDRWFVLTISEEQTTASLKKRQEYDPGNPPELSEIEEWLSNKLVLYGVIDSETISSWLKNPETEEIVIAKGESPVFGSPGTITYHFDTDFTQPGTINEDGSIDFRDRGEIPFVQKGDLLAQRTPAVIGKPGMSISGIPIPVDEVPDPLFITGPGTEISEDGLIIRAQIDGQPHVDAMGTFYVCSELVIKGDVDFDTGNIDFNGDIVVKGMVKEGFTVRGVSLTAREIDGAVIDLSGDLNVSAGINDSDIKVQGGIQAKFINNSTLMAFGDLMVSKEIIDSKILLSGACRNHSGHIISSEIDARQGGESGNIGTTSSIPVRIKIGGDQHIKAIEAQLDEQFELATNRIELFKEDLERLEQEDQTFYEHISKNAHIQDRAQVEAEKIKKSLPEIKQLNNLTKLARAEEKIKAFIKTADQAENELDTIFEAQNKLADSVDEIKAQVQMLEEKKERLEHQKNALTDFIKTQDPVTEFSVSGVLSQGTIIKGPRAAVTIKEDRSRCKVMEIENGHERIPEPEMVITDL